jgi:UDP-glucose 4-epimerase
LNKKKTVIAITRYGNVLASRGSVLPLFIDQILNNKPLTITDPKMTRFIMPMDKAIKLVLFAMRNAKGGEIFVQKTSASTIYNLAYATLKIFGKKKYKINIIGTRHGEKKYESLLTKEEFSIAKDFGDYYCIKSDQRDLNYDLYFNTGNKISTLHGNEDYNSNNTIQLSIDQIEKILKKLDILK